MMIRSMFHISRVVAHTSAEQSDAAVDNKALGIPWDSRVVQCTAKLMILNHAEPRDIIKYVFQHRTPDAVDAVLSVTSDLSQRAGGNRLKSQDF